MRELVLVLVVAAGCTTMPPGEHEAMEYKRTDARLKATEEYNALRAGCRAAGGVLVVEGMASRFPRTSFGMKSARCMESRPPVIF